MSESKCLWKSPQKKQHGTNKITDDTVANPVDTSITGIINRYENKFGVKFSLSDDDNTINDDLVDGVNDKSSSNSVNRQVVIDPSDLELSAEVVQILKDYEQKKIQLESLEIDSNTSNNSGVGNGTISATNNLSASTPAVSVRESNSIIVNSPGNIGNRNSFYTNTTDNTATEINQHSTVTSTSTDSSIPSYYNYKGSTFGMKVAQNQFAKDSTTKEGPTTKKRRISSFSLSPWALTDGIVANIYNYTVILSYTK